MRGHIRKRCNSWAVVVSLGRDPITGKRQRIWRAVKGSKKDAERVLNEIVHSVNQNGFIRPTQKTVGEFMKQWLKDYVDSGVRPMTAQSYVHYIERHIIPALGGVALAELQPSHFQAFYRKQLKEGRLDGKGGLSAQTVSHLHRIITNALNHAVKWGLLSRNVAQAVDPPRPTRKEMHALDADGVEQLLSASQDTLYYPFIHLAIYTGMRRSELLGLRWRDVDLEMATISVVQVMHQLRDRRIIFQEPKSTKGKRQIALSPIAVLALRKHKEHQELEGIMIGVQLTKDSLVFCHADGSPLLPNSVTHSFIKITRRIGLNGVRFHDLRHTHASLMLRAGIHPKVVSERLGHANIGITLDTYSHVVPGLQEAAAMAFEESLHPEKKRFSFRE